MLTPEAKRARKVRAKNLSEADVAEICRRLAKWTGALTWEKLIEDVEANIGQTYDRQALAKRPAIATAFSTRKRELRDDPIYEPARLNEDPALTEMRRQRDEARAEAKMKDAELARLRRDVYDQFARWVYNAAAKGFDEAFLNQPLPPIDRERTKL